jgi:hypothetical protein
MNWYKQTHSTANCVSVYYSCLSSFRSMYYNSKIIFSNFRRMNSFHELWNSVNININTSCVIIRNKNKSILTQSQEFVLYLTEYIIAWKLLSYIMYIGNCTKPACKSGREQQHPSYGLLLNYSLKGECVLLTTPHFHDIVWCIEHRSNTCVLARLLNLELLLAWIRVSASAHQQQLLCLTI